MRAIIVDDEDLALQSMVRLLQRFEMEVVGAFQDPREAIKHHVELGAEVAFLDIEMPELNGLELAASLLTDNPALHIVFVTAYEQYAIEAFELDAVDYLLKPLQLKRLEMTIKRLKAKRSEQDPRDRERHTPTLRLFHHLDFLDPLGNVLDIPWRTTKAKELLAFLIHSGEKTPNKEELLDVIWPDIDLDRSITHLHTTIYQIRQTMKNADIPLRVDYKEGRYRVELSNLQIDSRNWEQSVRAAASEEDLDAMHDLLMIGYRGDYLEKEGYLWAESERERLRTLWFEHAIGNAARMEANDLVGKAISLYQQLQLRFPESEQSYFGLMRMYDKLGNASEVHQQYAKLAGMLAEEFGIMPDPQIIDWFSRWKERKSS
jgi:two-component system LytT family response regulator